MDVIIVAHPDDEILEFSSVLLSKIDELPLVLVCTEGNSIRTIFLEDLANQGKISGVFWGHQASISNCHLDLNYFKDFIKKHLPVKFGKIWTHSPADLHYQHCQIALAVSELAEESDIFYSHGIFYSEYQFIADVCVPLTLEQIEYKIQVLNEYYHEQAQYHPEWRSSGFTTTSIMSVEKFVQLSQAEVKQLYALRNHIHKPEISVEDLWEVQASAYENQRITATFSWIQKWIKSPDSRIVKVSSSEEKLISVLSEVGYSNITACEANPVFYQRLKNKLANTSVVISQASLETLAETKIFPADYYILLEVVRYIRDLDLLNLLPTNLLLISASEQYLVEVVEKWLDTSQTWQILEKVMLVPSQVEFCCGKKSFCRKPGNNGLVLSRCSL